VSMWSGVEERWVWLDTLDLGQPVCWVLILASVRLVTLNKGNSLPPIAAHTPGSFAQLLERMKQTSGFFRRPEVGRGTGN
jgi:hypothetical protein